MSEASKAGPLATIPPAQRPEKIVMEASVPVLDTGMFEHMVRIARLMATSSLVPAHLNAIRREGSESYRMSPEEAQANCFLVVNQSVRWRMDPFAVAQHVYVEHGRIGYEGKLVAAVINTHPSLERRLSYKFEGTGGKRKVAVTGRIRGDTEDRSVEGSVEQWQTFKKDGTTVKEMWQKIPDQMLVYRGAREWARRWMPEAILGVYADEELEFSQGEQQPANPSQESSKASAGVGDRLRTAMGVDKPEPAVDAAKKAEPEPAKPAGEPAPGTTDSRSRKEIVGGEEGLYKGTGSSAAAPAATKSSEPGPGKQGERGTQELKSKFLRSFGTISDPEVLAISRDEASFYAWEDADRKELDEAYRARAAAIAG